MVRRIVWTGVGMLCIATAAVLWWTWRLERTPPTEGVEFLQAELKSESPDRVVEAAKVLGEIGPPAKKAVPALLGLLESEDEEIVYAVTRALGEIAPEDERVLSTLRDATLSPNWVLAHSSLNTLRRIQSRISPENVAQFWALLDRVNLDSQYFDGGNSGGSLYELQILAPPPDVAAVGIGGKLVSSGIAPGPSPATPYEAISVMQETLCRNEVSGKLKRFVLLWLGKIGTQESIDAITAFEAWAENSRPKHGEPPELVHPGTTHFASGSGVGEPWLTCEDAAGATWELYRDGRYGDAIRWPGMSKNRVYRVAMKGSDEPSVWVGIFDVDDGTYSALLRTDQYSLEAAAPGQLTLHVGERAFTFDLEESKWDTDGDGLTDVVETMLTTDAENADTDGDGVVDGVDGNPLTPKGDVLSDEQGIRQALFTYLWATSNSVDTILVKDQDQEFYGYPGIVLPAAPGRSGFVTVTFGKMEYLSDMEVKVEIEDYAAPLAASGNEAVVRKCQGKWVVVQFRMLWIA